MNAPRLTMDELIPPPSGLPTKMPFIVSSNVDRFDPATRKLIRSHVMRGKKQKNKIGAQTRQKSTNFTKSSQVKLQDVIDIYMALPPSRVGSHLYFVDFPSDIEPSILLKMAEVSTVAMRIIFPLLMEIGLHLDGRAWLYPAARDVVALHINAFTIQSFIDRVLHGQPADQVNPVAMLHHQKGLMLLQERLNSDDDKAKISDDTISAILKLASAALFDGDTKISRQHIQGLRMMVDLRGGIDALEGSQKLLVEIWRCDLGIALLGNSDPVFYHHMAEPVPDYPEQLTESFGPRIRSSEDSSFVQDLNVDLAEVWRVTKKFCLLVNLGTQTQRLIQPSTIYGTMTAVMYRLVQMGFVAGSLDETIRLGLLAFTHHVFLQWKNINLPCHGFSHRYRYYFVVHQLEDTIPSQAILWLLMTGAVSIFRISEEPWLGYCLQRQTEQCGVKSWKDLQGALKACMWIPLLDEERGKQTYEWFNRKP